MGAALMEYYESTCTKCSHRWQWVGYKTGIGKTPKQLAEMAVAGKICPRCKGEAKVGLDMVSEDAQGLSSALGAFLVEAFHGVHQAATPAPAPTPVPPEEQIPNNYGCYPLAVNHAHLTRVGDSMFKSECPVCEKGVLLVRRDPDTFEILADDNCIYCGQRYKYMDIVSLRQGQI